jgi:hypothetical protein
MKDMKNPMTKLSVSLPVTSRRDTKAVNVILCIFQFTKAQYVLLRDRQYNIDSLNNLDHWHNFILYLKQLSDAFLRDQNLSQKSIWNFCFSNEYLEYFRNSHYNAFVP